MLLPLVLLHVLILEGVAQEDEWNSEETVHGTSGHQVSFRCRNPTLNAGDSISWYRIRETDASQLKTNRTSIDHNGTLHFAFVDASDSGTYKCGVNSATSSTISLGSRVNFIVSNTEGPSERKPELMHKSPDTKVDPGRNIELACAFAGKPVPTISWRHNGETMTSDERIKLDGGKLSIDAVTQDDTGDYTCVGNNVAGSSSETIRLQLKDKVTAKPTTTTEATNDEIPTAESTTGGSKEQGNSGEQVDKSDDNPSSASSTTIVIIVVVIVVVIVIAGAVIGFIVWRGRKIKKERRLARITKGQREDLVVES